VLLALMMVLAIPHLALAEAPRIIELNDGSRITGSILGYNAGVYTIESASLGRLQLRDEQIRSIRSPTSSSSSEPAGTLGSLSQNRATQGQLMQIQNRILANPEVLMLVMSLQQDPEVIALLNDPQVMQAILSGQADTLQDHPKIRQMENNPTIQKIMQILSP